MAIFEYIGIFRNLIKYYMSCIKYYNKVTIQNVTGTREFTVYTTAMKFFCFCKYHKNGSAYIQLLPLMLPSRCDVELPTRQYHAKQYFPFCQCTMGWVRLS